MPIMGLLYILVLLSSTFYTLELITKMTSVKGRLLPSRDMSRKTGSYMSVDVLMIILHEMA